MPTLDSIRGRMIEIHTARTGMHMREIYNQVQRELGYSFPFKYIEDTIQIVSENDVLSLVKRQDRMKPDEIQGH